jgi:hypothetical protein
LRSLVSRLFGDQSRWSRNTHLFTMLKSRHC